MFFDDNDSYEEERVIERTRSIRNSNNQEINHIEYSKYTNGDSDVLWAYMNGIPTDIHNELIAIRNSITKTLDAVNILLVGNDVDLRKYAEFIYPSPCLFLDCSNAITQHNILDIFTTADALSVICLNNINELSSTNLKCISEIIKYRESKIAIGKGNAAKYVHLALPPTINIASCADITILPSTVTNGFDYILYADCLNKIDKEIMVKQIANELRILIPDDIAMDIASSYDSKIDIKRQLLQFRLGLYKNTKTDIDSKVIYDIYEVDEMDGILFENFTKRLLLKNGFTNVTVTKSSGDYGADLIAEKDEIKYAIQCKRYNGQVGVDAVKEVIASRSIYSCHVGCVLTNSRFTNAALELAKSNLVLMWDRNRLIQLMNA